MDPILSAIAGALFGTTVAMAANRAHQVITKNTLARLSRGLGIYGNRQVYMLQVLLELCQASGRAEQHDQLLQLCLQQLADVQRLTPTETKSHGS